MKLSLPSSMHTPWAGSNRKQCFRSSISFRVDSQSIPFTLTTSLFTLQATTSANGAYTPPAKLDTGRAANTYPGGIPTRLSSNHFQSARARHGYPNLCKIEVQSIRTAHTRKLRSVVLVPSKTRPLGESFTRSGDIRFHWNS